LKTKEEWVKVLERVFLARHPSLISMTLTGVPLLRSMMRLFRWLTILFLACCILQTASAQTLSLPKRLRVRPGDVFYIDIRGDALIRGLTGVQLTLNYKLKQPADAPPLVPLLKDPKSPSELLIFELLKPPLVVSTAIRDEALVIVAVSFSQTKAGFGPGMLMAIPFQSSPATPPGSVYNLFFSRHDVGGVDSLKSTTQTIAVLGSVIVDPTAPQMGDMNGDGNVNVADVVKLVRFVTKLETPTDQQLYNGDLSPHDGKITVTDIVGTLKKAVGFTVPFGPALQ
jgi:hypothetical protein